MAEGPIGASTLLISIGITSSPYPVAAQPLPTTVDPIEVLTVSGQVTDFYEGVFKLRHTQGVVEMTFGNWPSARETRRPYVEIGDNVTVSVEMDEMFVEGGVSSVVAIYSEDSRTFSTFGTPTAGAESAMRPLVSPFDVVGDRGDATLSGTIIEVSSEGFVLSAGAAEVDVDTSTLFYNPYDTIGGQRLEVGDLVAVSGLLNPGFPQDSDFTAEQVVEVRLIGYSG
ncbi:hypothetical protein [Jannaschia formosa]|uniref:hypothetical protein n=1 Tax=Jannaschia formosa TaxID=2259592 RepID=UPI0010757EB6|nr:hypothetical protein [Jannaschia formosa]TFL15912.1 hypothetical protein DR046_22890 [Jannaschia formosa]